MLNSETLDAVAVNSTSSKAGGRQLRHQHVLKLIFSGPPPLQVQKEQGAAVGES